MNKKNGNQVGDDAPDFELKDAADASWRLSEQRGKTVVLLFYPGDNTPVCTSQLCSVREHWSDYQATGAEVVGISTDSVKSHENFAAKHRLPLRLLADERGEVTQLFGVKSWLPNRSGRAVFVIDKQGVIRYRKVQALSIMRPKDDDVLAAIKESGS
ncbi:MAG TPA: peroxiredoxin [Pyrinomonadaceae bacterium]|nr:peroxiredoxin [Pyrinomonadaceae bacterium]